ncbi:MAG: hypothetical protein IPK17_37250 [Chloroflexi bacterium]|uniref:hypothetical protein n=1 Tax=Candidatus Flexifilum breve TaxID=3140694 RepID=UPI003136F024|nr:hypothetical protein [Chloroflexota bacterium]
MLYFRQIAAERPAQEVETERLRMALENEREINHLRNTTGGDDLARVRKTPSAAIYTASETIENLQ